MRLRLGLGLGGERNLCPKILRIALFSWLALVSYSAFHDFFLLLPLSMQRWIFRLSWTRLWQSIAGMARRTHSTALRIRARLRTIKPAWFLWLLLCFTGCHESGTWQDDPKNFDRVFRTSQPKDVVVVHSRFWRSPHWTYEFEYFIQIQPNDKFTKSLFDHNKFKGVRLTNSGTDSITHFVQDRPAWFLPKPISNYEVWAYADEPNSRCRLFIDKISKELFLSDNQI
jgi:hypothetical protein